MQTAIMLPEQSISEEQFTSTTWLRYFDVQAAIRDLHVHLGTKLSDKTPEKHTRRNYMRGIKYFIQWAGYPSMELPSEQLVKRFIAHLLHDKEWVSGQVVKNGVSAQTVANNYLAPLRIFINALIKQPVHVNGYERDFVNDCKEAMRVALTVKNPSVAEADSTLWNPKFTRLNPAQINDVMKSFERDTVKGARDYAIFRLFFESGFRAAELQRVRLKDIEPMGHYSLITVRGKGSKKKPVAVSAECIEAIEQWVELYHAGMAVDDPRRITASVPVFQPLTSGGNVMAIDRVYDPTVHTSDKNLLNRSKGLSYSAIKLLVKKTTKDVLGGKWECAPHDLRRTFAANCYNSGMKIPQIKKAMRHKSAAITMEYIGEKPTYDDTLITDFVSIA